MMGSLCCWVFVWPLLLCGVPPKSSPETLLVSTQSSLISLQKLPKSQTDFSYLRNVPCLISVTSIDSTQKLPLSHHKNAFCLTTESSCLSSKKLLLSHHRNTLFVSPWKLPVLPRKHPSPHLQKLSTSSEISLVSFTNFLLFSQLLINDYRFGA